MVHIEKQIDAETKEVWSFNLFDTKAVFVGWAKYTKPKGKRKWEAISLWDKYARRNSITVPEHEGPSGHHFSGVFVGILSEAFSEPIEALRFADAFVEHVNMRRREKAAQKIIKQEVLQ